MPSYTFSSTANAALNNRLKVSWIDVNEEDLCSNVREFNKSGIKKKIYVPVHYGSSACDMTNLNYEKISELVGIDKRITKSIFPPEINLKKSVGIQWRINGFSFYNFPTALELEYHQPLTTFSRTINNDKITYGDRSKTYVKILFDF